MLIWQQRKNCYVSYTVRIIFTRGFVPMVAAGLFVGPVVRWPLRKWCPVTGQTHTAASLCDLPLPLPIPPGIAVRGMAPCLGVQHAISLAHALVVGPRDGAVPTGVPPIIVAIHFFGSRDTRRPAFPPVRWAPEVHLQWSPICRPDLSYSFTTLWIRWVFIMSPKSWYNSQNEDWAPTSHTLKQYKPITGRKTMPCCLSR